MDFIFTVIKIMVVVLFICTVIACLQGCAGTGFDKRATLVPDSVGITFGQSRYREEDAAYRGFMINLNWELK